MGKKNNKRIINIGDVFYRWKVIEDLGTVTQGKTKRHMYLCECSCAKHTRRAVSGSSLVKGKSKSCGCLTIEKTIERSITHGLSNHPLYHVHKDMIRRCYNPNFKEYDNYGGRGIYIVSIWYTPGVPGNPGFMEFYNWSINNGYEKGLEIDRIDNNGPYAPWNCRWVSKKVNINNRRNTHKFLIDGIVYDQSYIDKLLSKDDNDLKRASSITYSRFQKGHTVDSIIHEIKTGERIKRDKFGVFRNQYGERRLLRKYLQPDDVRFYKSDTYYHLDLDKYGYLLKYAPHIAETLMERY